MSSLGGPDTFKHHRVGNLYLRGPCIGHDDISEYYAARSSRKPRTNNFFVLRVLTKHAATSPEMVKWFTGIKDLKAQAGPDVYLLGFGEPDDAGPLSNRPYQCYRIDTQANLLAALTFHANTSGPQIGGGRYRLCARIARDSISEYYTAVFGVQAALATTDTPDSQKNLNAVFVVRIVTEDAARRPELTPWFGDATQRLFKLQDIHVVDVGVLESGRSYAVYRVGEQDSSFLAALNFGAVTNEPITIKNRFHLYARVGQDEISEYYTARHVTPDSRRMIVVRLLTNEAARQPEVVSRFREYAMRLCDRDQRPDSDLVDFDSIPSDDGTRERLYLAFRMEADMTNLMPVLTDEHAPSPLNVKRDLPTAPAPAPIPTDNSVLRHYELGARIGHDEISEYYMARSKDINTSNVVRILTDEAARTPDVVSAFLNGMMQVKRNDIRIVDFDMIESDTDPNYRRMFAIFRIGDQGGPMLGALTVAATKIVDKRYQLGAHIGRDDISDFYAARHASPELDKKFVIRFMTYEAAGDAKLRERFVQLAQELSKKPRDGVAVEDFGSTEIAPNNIAIPYMVFGMGSGDPLAVIRIDA